jgi:hypothetical protein
MPIIFLVVVLWLSAAVSHAQQPPKLSSVQQEVLDAHNARVAAVEKRDFTTYARLVADDCISSDDDGILDTNPKAHVLEHWKLPLAYDHGVNPREFVIHVYDNSAVLNYRVTIHEQFSDADIISEQRYTETFIKRDGRWMLIARQWGNLPVNFHKPVAVDARVYKDYVGEYQWRPLGKVETLFVRDGRLWSRFPTNEDEYLPLGSDTFFVKDDAGSMTFVRDVQRRVTGYTYHRWDGQEIHVKKVR